MPYGRRPAHPSHPQYRYPIKRGRRRRPRKLPLYRMMRRPRNQITSAVFRYVMPIIENKVISTVGQANADHIAPALTDMPGSLCYKNLFAQFRVCKIKVEFIPTVSRNMVSTDATTANTYERPLFATSINRVATSFPQDLEQIMTTSSVKYTPCGNKLTRYYTPVTFDTIFNGTFSTEGLNPEYKQWVSTNYATVAHHGCSWVIQAASNLPQGMYKYTPVVTMYAQFKNRRVNTSNVDDEDTEEA